MKDIKTKELDRKPKVLEKASRMPKELAKRTMLEAKEKSLQGSRLSEGAEHPESPAGYASDKMETAVKRMAEDTGRASVKAFYAAGRKAAQKTYEKLSGSKAVKESARTNSSQIVSGNAADGGRERGREKAKREAARKQQEKGRDTRKSTAGTGSRDNPSAIRTKETNGQTAPVKMVREKDAARAVPVKSNQKLSVKQAPRVVKSSSLSGRYPKRAAASAGRQVQAAKAAKQAAVKSMQRTAVRAE